VISPVDPGPAGASPASRACAQTDPTPTTNTPATTDPANAHAPRELPFVDAYAIEADAPSERVWDVIVEQVLPRFGGGFGPAATGRIGRVGTRLLRAPYAPPAPTGAGTGSRLAGARGRAGGAGPSAPSVIMGFRVEQAERPGLIALAGEHRFARYSLTLRVTPSGSGSTSRLSAETRAAFPGVAGWTYRTAVIGTGAHRLVVSRLLHRIRRLARPA
jgi:hypothetical protein